MHARSTKMDIRCLACLRATFAYIIGCLGNTFLFVDRFGLLPRRFYSGLYSAGNRLLRTQSLLTDFGVQSIEIIQEALRYPLLSYDNDQSLEIRFSNTKCSPSKSIMPWIV